MSPVVALFVESLQRTNSGAIGAQRTWRELVGRVDPTLLTHQRHWLCAAAMVFMSNLSPIKVLV
jgi:hypothetical protein